eukprot:4718425-Pyramimonas_sp.AAC.1
MRGAKAFWPPGAAARGGIGIIVKLEFLKRFNLAEPVWGELECGRFGWLSLRGPDGALDLHSAHPPLSPAGRRKALRSEPSSARAQAAGGASVKR